MTDYAGDAFAALDEGAVLDILAADLGDRRRRQLQTAPNEQPSFAFNHIVRDVLVAHGRITNDGTADEQARQVTEKGWSTSKPDGLKLYAAVWTLVARGLIIPEFWTAGAKPGNGAPSPITRLTLTSRGERFVLDGAARTPLGAHFVAAFKDRCPNTSQDDDLGDVHARMEDAVECLEALIPRAAVAMVGLAFEVTLRRARDAYNVPRGGTARDTLGEVRRAVEALPNSERERRHRLQIALGVAEAVRLERNRAAHEASARFDQVGAEELTRCAAHHIPVFWTDILRA